MEKVSFRTFPKWSLLILIKGYQLCLSPFFGMACRFDPTCSQYSIEAIERYGAIKGLWFCIIRLLKCHPFHPGGRDSVLDR